MTFRSGIQRVQPIVGFPQKVESDGRTPIQESLEADSNLRTQRELHSGELFWRIVSIGEGIQIDESEGQLRGAESPMNENLDPVSTVTTERASPQRKHDTIHSRKRVASIGAFAARRFDGGRNANAKSDEPFQMVAFNAVPWLLVTSPACPMVVNY
jgi:hypothetical protein